MNTKTYAGIPADFVGPVFHPLVSKNIRPLAHWEEWLKRWGEAQGYEELFGLLHTGFDVPIGGYKKYYPEREEYTSTDRIMFYLSVAEQWMESGISTPGLCWQDEPECKRIWTGNRTETKSCRDIRAELAKKAFTVLISCAWKPLIQSKEATLSEKIYLRDTLEESWNNKELFDAYMLFFRAEKDAIPNFYRLRSFQIEQLSDIQKTAWKFLKLLISYVLASAKPPKPTDEEVEDEETSKAFKERHLQAKKWAFEVLEVLDETHILPSLGYKILEDEDKALLVEIAMRNKIRHNGQYNCNGNYRPVESLEEAAYVGSASAHLLLKVMRDRAIKAKLDAVFQAEEEMKEAERKLKALQGNK
jgi:hypothetical protein